MSIDTAIITGLGINCETETQQACYQAGFGVSLIPLTSLYRHGTSQLEKTRLIIFPGGFLDGDDLGCAQACVNRFRYCPLPDGKNFLEYLLNFIQGGGLILGICNGFQLLVKLGLLPEPSSQTLSTPSTPLPKFTLTHNAHGRFENRWVELLVNQKSPCIFTKDLTRISLPIRHGQGQLLSDRPDQLKNNPTFCPLYYCDPQGKPTEEYPHNPNHSPHGMAALCDPSGRILGLMPHPEAACQITQHPSWTRSPSKPAGLSIFQNAYRFLEQNKQP